MSYTSHSAYRKSFENILNMLNEQQLAAVNHFSGPTLVLAGPGTGKTQILAARIGKILMDTDTQPHEVLCLTYTDAGTIAMRQRLLNFIGPDAYRVGIYTFHAFCNEVIQDNLDYFGQLSLDPLSDLESALLFRELIDELPNDHLLKRFTGGVYYDIPRLKNLFKAMKREDWSIATVEQTVKKYLEEIPFREAFTYKRSDTKAGIKIGDVKQKKLDEAREKMDQLMAAVHLYDSYLNKMQERSRYDYDDMILWVLRAFKENKYLLRTLHERYQYILVDEFQDTSGSQNEVLRYLVNYSDKPNICVIGDDDQSIFKFQGANMRNMLDFTQTYASSLYTVVLKENYRSTQAILDLAHALIDENKERLSRQLHLDKHLLVANPQCKQIAHASPIIRAYKHPDHELIAVAKQIEALISSGVDPASIAVLYRKHHQAADLIQCLGKKRLPLHTKRAMDMFSLPFVEKLINILRYFSMELAVPYSGDALLFELLHYDFFPIAPIELAKACAAVAHENYKYDRPKTSLRRYLTEIACTDNLFERKKNWAVKSLMQVMESLLKQANNVTVQQFFQEMIAKMDILKYILQQADKLFYMQVLNRLFDFIKEENRKKPAMKIADLIALLDLMKEHTIFFPFNDVSLATHGVQFLTVYASKGLEFAYVFLIGATHEVWDKKGKNKHFNYPDTLTQASLDDLAHKEEARRVFYVALTRAKHSLFISYAQCDKNGKDVEATQFISELLSKTSLQTEHPTLSDDELLDFHSTYFSEAKQPVAELIDKNYIEFLLQNYALSVTHLNNFLDCPLKFYFQSLIKVPASKSPAATLGQAVHWALHKAFLKMQAGENTFPDLSFFMKQFSWYLHRNKDAFTEQDFKRYIGFGEQVLAPYYIHNVPTWNKLALTEKRIRNVELNGIPLTGNLDKVEFNGKQVSVVDYKTGKFKNAKKRLYRPSPDQPQGGNYWRQAVFYKILVDRDYTNDWEVTSVEFDFVEPTAEGKYHKEKITIMPEDVSLVTNQIETVYQKIRQHEFKEGCGKEECSWCCFVRSQ